MLVKCTAEYIAITKRLEYGYLSYRILINIPPLSRPPPSSSKNMPVLKLTRYSSRILVETGPLSKTLSPKSGMGRKLNFPHQKKFSS